VSNGKWGIFLKNESSLIGKICHRHLKLGLSGLYFKKLLVLCSARFDSGNLLVVGEQKRAIFSWGKRLGF
jgi:hypothetical protein